MPDKHSPALWDSVARSYDGMRPDQGLTDPAIRAAWLVLLNDQLPSGTQTILDAGCGTGTLTLLLAEAGYTVAGIDFSPAMIAAAREKAGAAGTAATFRVEDATAPSFPTASLDAIVCRQALWALPDRRAALANWANLLREHGRLILIEGRFASGNGLSAEQIAADLPASFTAPEVTDISQKTDLWGGPIPDQRLLVVTTKRPAATA